MSFLNDLVKNPILNPIGFIATNKTATQRVGDYMKTQSIPKQFVGTAADWEVYRRNWIDGCMSDNSNGWLQSKNKTRAACQSYFDKATYHIQQQFAAENLQDKNYIKSMITTDSPAIYIGIFLFVGVIIYLLTSKS